LFRDIGGWDLFEKGELGTLKKLSFRVPAEFEIAIGIEIGSGNVSLAPIFDSDFDLDPDFGPQLS
jgi:hypothetical protein